VPHRHHTQRQPRTPLPSQRPSRNNNRPCTGYRKRHPVYVNFCCCEGLPTLQRRKSFTTTKSFSIGGLCRARQEGAKARQHLDAALEAFRAARALREVGTLLRDLGDSGTAATGQLTTSWTLDERGLPATETDPDGNVTYSYTANGTLQSEQTPSGTVTWAFYAYGDQVQSGTQAYSGSPPVTRACRP
jgi:YD repeat-containing protein